MHQETNNNLNVNNPPINKIIKCHKCFRERDSSFFIKDRTKTSGIKDHICKECRKTPETINFSLDNCDVDRITKPDLLKLYETTEYDKKINKVTCFSSIFIGSSKSGKSTLIKGLIKEMEGRFDLIVIFSESIHDQMYDFVKYDKKSKYIAFDTFQPDFLKDLMEINKHTRNAFNFFVLFDDMTGLKTRDNDEILQLFIRGRNSGMSIFFSTQYYAFLQRAVRANTNFVYILRTSEASVRETIATNFLYNLIKTPQELRNKTAKMEWYNNCIVELTKNYGCIVIDNLSDPPKAYKYRESF